MPKKRYWRNLLFVLSLMIFLVYGRSYAEETTESAAVPSEPVFSETFTSDSFGEGDFVIEGDYVEPDYTGEGNISEETPPSDTPSEENTSSNTPSNESVTTPPTPPVSNPTNNGNGNSKPDKTNVKVTICHKGSETITVAEESVINAHLKHGDTIGACVVVVTPPVTDKPATTDKPVTTDKPTNTDKPSTGKPTSTTDKPAADKPATDKPATDSPSTTAPSTDKPTNQDTVTPPVVETPVPVDETVNETPPAATEDEPAEETSPLQCQTDRQCSRGEVCESNTCVPVCKRLGCCSDVDCPSGQICENAECVVASRCVFDSDCGTGRECQAGRCTVSFVDPTEQCQDNSHCGTSEFCIEKQCVSCSLLSCCTDGNCEGKKCCSGQCQQCCTNSDCRSGSCINGKCQSSELAVLADFEATPATSSILLAWETAAELDNAGFHIWRAQVKDGQYVDITRLTAQLLPSKSMMDWLGATYRYEDATVTPGITYYYALEDIDFYGVSTVHLDRVVSATVTANSVAVPESNHQSATMVEANPKPPIDRRCPSRKPYFLKFK